YRTLRRSIERAAMTVGRSDARLRVQVSDLLWNDYRRSARQHQIGLIIEQGLATHTDRDKRSRARSLNGCGRTFEIELVCHSRGQVIVLVVEKNLKRVVRI